MNAPKNHLETSLFSLLKRYTIAISMIILLTVLSGGLSLMVPKMIASTIDSFTAGDFDIYSVLIEFSILSVLIFVLTYGQNIVQTYASERVARDLRARIITKISEQEFSYIESVTPAKLLTNLTSDVDAVKNFVAQAIASMISSLFMIVGASALLLWMNWRLALAVLVIMPIIGIMFTLVFRKVRTLFKISQETIDHLNKIINESILGAALIRLLNSEMIEYEKFIVYNTKAKEIGLSILTLFATLIPIITLTANIALLVILILGGHFVIAGSMTLGDFSAFNGYLSILIFPIIVIGFMSTAIAQATASYGRILEVLNAVRKETWGTKQVSMDGSIRVSDVSLVYGEKTVLQHIDFSIQPRSRTAIMGPTAAGKTQLLYLLSGLIEPTSGNIAYNDTDIKKLDKNRFYKHIGLIFQDSVIFQMTLRENITFSEGVSDVQFQKAIHTAELGDFIRGLPQGLDTIISEQGSNLSGGQKQRIMLARALVQEPNILLLDDFTARLDVDTERKILENLGKNYPNITLISITEKVAATEGYDQIILMMEGEIIALGKHDTLMQTSPEYVQIYTSQQSTNAYELSA